MLKFAILVAFIFVQGGLAASAEEPKPSASFSLIPGWMRRKSEAATVDSSSSQTLLNSSGCSAWIMQRMPFGIGQMSQKDFGFVGEMYGNSRSLVELSAYELFFYLGNASIVLAVLLKAILYARL